MQREDGYMRAVQSLCLETGQSIKYSATEACVSHNSSPLLARVMDYDCFLATWSKGGILIYFGAYKNRVLSQTRSLCSSAPLSIPLALGFVR